MQAASYRKYLLGLLMVVLAFNFIDRIALGIVLEDIKAEFSLSDTQLGLLSGLAFALFYSVMGIPIARWADRGNRRTIIALTTALWSAAVALCAAATSFVQLLLIRVGVAVGEAGCIPPAHSLIADYFNREERPRAVAIYAMGASLSLVLGYFFAGWLNQFYGWRTTFLVLSLPGLLLAALAWWTVREPRQVVASTPVAQPAIAEVLATLWTNATFRHLLLCLAVAHFFIYGVLQWQPAFFMRSYGLQTGEIGTWFALIHGGCGLLGTYFGGTLASRYAGGNESLQLRGAAILYCNQSVFLSCAYLVTNVFLAFAFLGLAYFSLAATNGPLFGTIQTIVPPSMRAMSIAIVYLFANLIGMGLGPLAAGALSDAFRVVFAEESLRYALLAMSPGYLWCMWHAWRASQTVTVDLPAMQVDEARPASTSTLVVRASGSAS